MFNSSLLRARRIEWGEMLISHVDLAGVQPRVLLAVLGADHEIAGTMALLRELRCMVVRCDTMRDAVLRIGVMLPHLIIISAAPLPGMRDACRIMRATTTAHILALGRSDEESDEVLCLEAGADTYLALPLSPRRLEAQVRALLRRAMVASPPRALEPILFGEIRIDMQRRRVFRDGVELMLSHKEYGLLVFLVHHAGQTVTRQALSQFVWGTEAADDSRSLDVHIHWLREKLERDPRKPRHIHTVRGVGYRFEVQPDPAEQV
jgi:two-component system response regulator RegX3